MYISEQKKELILKGNAVEKLFPSLSFSLPLILSFFNCLSRGVL